MDCKQYNESLADAALGVLEGQCEAELRAHLARCHACRAALKEQKLLFEAIDCGLNASIGGKPSPGFVAHVRMRLAEERLPKRLWLPGWAHVAAGALVVLVLTAVWLVRREPVVPGEFESARQAPIAEGVPSEKVAQQPLPIRPFKQALAHRGVAPRRPVRRVAGTDDPEVLVPSGEGAAVLRLYSALWSGRADAVSLLAQPVPLEPGALKIPPLAVATLELESGPLNPARER